jgi:hypothetical protein
VEQVQFGVAQVLDSCTEVLRQHMSVRGRIGCYLCGRYRLYGRWRTVSDRRHGREQVGRRLLTTIASHGGIMPPPMSASNFGRTCPPGGHAPSAVVGVAGRAGRVPVPTGPAPRNAFRALSNADRAYCVVPCPALAGFGTRDK